MNRPLLVSLGLLLCAACQERPEYRASDPAARVAEAETRYSPALFDTVAWSGQEARLAAGNDVYIVECRRCHGAMGDGDTSYAREHGIEVPSLVAADWPHGDDVEAVRRRTYVGHPDGMPIWGDARLSPREIDAAAFYIVEQLRPEARAAARRSQP